MRNRFKNSAETCTLSIWCLLPLAGMLTPLAFLLFTPFCRNREGPFRPELLAFTGLTALYVAYTAIRAMAAGPWATASEPIGDAMTLLICTGLLTFALRGRERINLSRVYCWSSVTLILVFVLTAVQYFYTSAPAYLLMQNQLNLGPLLIAPAILCTIFHFAPSTGWKFLGWCAFTCTLVTVGLLIQTRGPLLVMVGIALLRLISLLTAKQSHRLKTILALIAGLMIGLAAPILDDTAKKRMNSLVPGSLSAAPLNPATSAGSGEEMTVSVQPVTDRSLNHRFAMLSAGWHAFKDAPLWGHGPQNRFSAAAPYFPPDFNRTYSHLHNDFVTHAVAGGIVAVLLLSLILLFPLFAAFRSRGGNRRQKVETGMIFSCAFIGTALGNNVLFVDISAFSLGLSSIVVLLLIEAE